MQCIETCLTFATFISPIVVFADNEVGVLTGIIRAYPDWKPRGIVDVGANQGNWTERVHKHIFPGVKTFMLEASPKRRQALEEKKKKIGPNIVDFQIAVLSSKDGDTVEFFDGEGEGTGSSIFQEQSKHFKGVIPDVRKTSKLDTLVKHMEYVDYLKLDVQGAELMVLSGATETLKRTTFVQFEVSVVEYNKGGVCWHELDAFLRQHGFHFYDSGDLMHNPIAFHTKGVGQLDMVYIKPSSDFMPKWLVDNNVKFCGSGREETRLIRGNSTNDNGIIKLHVIIFFMYSVVICVAGYWIGHTKAKQASKLRLL